MSHKYQFLNQDGLNFVNFATVNWMGLFVGAEYTHAPFAIKHCGRRTGARQFTLEFRIKAHPYLFLVGSMSTAWGGYIDADSPKKADSMTIHMNIVLLASACLVWTQAPCLTGLFKTL